MAIPKINSAHGSDTRNIINATINSVNAQGKTIQDLVAKGQLTPSQYLQLIQAVNGLISKGDASFDDIDINKGKLLPKHLSEEVLKMLTGDAPVNAVPADGSLTTRKYAEKSVTQNKTNFLKLGKNLFKKTDVTFDKLLSYTSDNISDTAGYVSQLEYIPAQANTTYHRNTEAVVVCYDSEHNRIGGFAWGKGVFTTPPNTAYIRFSTTVSQGRLNTLQIEKGSSETPYESFRWEIDGLYTTFENNTLNGNAVMPSTINKEKLDFKVPEVIPSKNLFDKSKAAIGFFVNQSNGQLVANSAHSASDFIGIEPSGKYSVTPDGALRVVFYDINKNFIEGHLTPTSPITAPDNAYFAMVSFSSSALENFQFVKGSTLGDYEPYGYTLANFLGDQQSAGEDVIINIPSKIYAVVGEELNLYFDNVINGKDTHYEFDIDFGNKGQQFEDFFRFVPDVKETRTLTFRVIKNNQVLASKTTSVIVSTKASGSGTTKSAVVIGDSTTNNGITVTKLNENFSSDSMGLATLGTRGTGINKHEGRSGWTARQFVATQSASGVTNAFYNPSTNKFDFSYYLSNNSIARPDYVIINLGINDMFSITSEMSLESKMDEAIADFETMINSIKANSSTIKIGLALTIPPNYSQDAFAKDYSTGQTRWRYKRNNVLWVQRMIQHFSGKEAQNIYLIPTNSVIDTKYNYGFVEEKVNARSEITKQVSAANGGVHPVTSGYWQIADAYWFWLKSFES